MSDPTLQMRCPKCDLLRRASAKFCDQDGTKLVLEEKPPIPLEDVTHMVAGMKVETPDYGVQVVRECSPPGTFYFFGGKDALIHLLRNHERDGWVTRASRR